VKVHIRKVFPDLMQNGKTTFLNEVQAAAVLENIKQANNNQHNLQRSSGRFVSDPYSAVIKAKELSSSLHTTNEKAQAALIMFADAMSALQTENETLKGHVEQLNGRLRLRNEELIVAGLALSDRDDTAALYRGVR
jgi:hypothetical protein